MSIIRELRTHMLSIDISDVLDRNAISYVDCYGGGGGKAPEVQTVSAPPPPAPPSEEATMEQFDNEKIDKKKQKAKTQGASSLQIPLVGTGVDTTATVGTA